MYTAIMLDGNGVETRGGLELIDLWKNDTASYIWLDIEQVVDKREVAVLESFHCHGLAITDAHRTRHPPKAENFTDQTFILFRGITQMGGDLEIAHLQIAMFIGDRFLITRHNEPSYSVKNWQDYENLHELLKAPARLATSIMHYSCGLYLELLLNFESELSDLEDLLQKNANDNLLKHIILYKTRLRKLRRVFDYHQRLVQSLMADDSREFPHANDELQHHLRDLFDRCERLHSLSSLYYEICGDLVEGYISLSSHELNNTMRVLTVITAVFVPLSFIAGVYGMNFDVMPELKFSDGYFIVLSVMAATAISLLAVFRYKRWI